MKIRKLILKAKLQQIEKDSQYFFLYHCSGLKSAQWRQLKDLLSKTQAKSFFQPRSHKKEILRNFTLDKTSYSNQITMVGEGNFQSEDNSILRSLSGPFCIFYFTSRDDIQVPQVALAKMNSWREVLKIIDSLTSSGNLILLSGQMQSTIVNHIDIKKALNLEIQSVYQQFLSSIQYPLQNFNFCIDHNRIQVVSQLENLSRKKTNDNELS